MGILSLAFAGLLWFALALSGGEAVGSSPDADGLLILGVALLGFTLLLAAAVVTPRPRAGRVIVLVCVVGGSVLFGLLGLRSEGFLFYILLWAPFAALLLMVAVFGCRGSS